MMRTRYCTVALAMYAGGLLCAWLFVGCETSNEDAGLKIDPAYLELRPSTNTVEFTVAVGSRGTLSLPIEWRVADEGLGWIVGSWDYTALYQRGDRDGNNTVIARDQYGKEGYASVMQVPDPTTSSTTTTTSTSTTTSTTTTTTVAMTTTTVITTTTTTTVVATTTTTAVVTTTTTTVITTSASTTTTTAGPVPPP